MGTIQLGGSAYGVAVNARTNRIYVTNPVSPIVTVLDGATNTVVTTVGVGAGPLGVIVNEKTGRVYVTNLNSNTVSVIQD